MRLGIKGKQVLGVTSIVGAVVVLLSLVYLAGLARISLEESRARAELGFAPAVDLQSGARRTLAWYREQGWL